ncbi:NTP-PPase_u4 domain containing protein [uncultured Caudovirales phage]|uniref:NTP-PPase_u4 domain containing protein n=1 Tax=uncultured Caudovirales phage TaxID=2100421 RepID=A0A6J5KQX1_9CAUD|nr:NTP-PPase_u4 domain containing protein [uncultured Caudovirales phage]
MNVDLNRYKDFVQGVTSGASEDLEILITRMRALQSVEPQLNVSLLLTAGIGLASEGGEFDEIVKKMIFQGKPWNEETRHHMFRELGDICWYWVSACRAIGVDPNEVIEENVRKLESRYPGGTFDVHYSENRKEGDL